MKLIKNIVLFETNERNHQIVHKYRRMLEKIDEIYNLITKTNKLKQKNRSLRFHTSMVIREF